MGAPDDADNQCPQQDISRTHVPHERIDYGNQRHIFVPVSATDWSPLRRVGKEIFSSHHRLFHLCANTTHVNKLVVSSTNSFINHHVIDLTFSINCLFI
jgi:hypothetical protein